MGLAIVEAVEVKTHYIFRRLLHKHFVCNCGGNSSSTPERWLVAYHIGTKSTNWTTAHLGVSEGTSACSAALSAEGLEENAWPSSKIEIGIHIATQDGYLSSVGF